jgi:hypothetical protein
MHRFAWLVVLAACPPKPPGSQQPTSKAAGGPSASTVDLASFQPPAQGATHRAGWVLPLHDTPLSPGLKAPDYANLDASAAAVAAVPQAPTGNVWIVASNAAPCQAQIGKYYAVKLDEPSPNITYGAELDGCPAPVDQNDTEAVALVSQDAPSDCRFEAPNPIASRLGEIDQQKQWHAPTKETPIPPAIAAIVPPHDCKAPGCETLWAFAAIAIDNKPVAWSGAVNWITTGDPAKPCEWKAETFSGFFVPDANGKPVKIDQGQKHPLVLATALVDSGGARVLLAQGPGEYATYDVVMGGSSLGHTITWLLAPESTYATIDHLGPPCEQPRTPPPASR